MSDVLQTIFTVILSTEFIIGNLGNGFIALVNCMDWVRRRKLSSVDQILTALAISRITLIWLVLLNWGLCMLYPCEWITETMARMLAIIWTVISHFSIWFATSLSIFYFLKIANFSNTLFLYLKFRIKKVLSVTMVVSLLLLCLRIMVINIENNVWTVGRNRNTSSSSHLNNTQVGTLISIATTMFMFIPFAVSLITFLLLIISLWKHLRKMKNKARGHRDASTRAHIRALQNVVTFLLLYAIFFLAFALKVWSFMFLEKKRIILLSQVTRTVFPSVHSWVLVLGNKNLRQSLLMVLWRLRCRSKDVKPSGL